VKLEVSDQQSACCAAPTQQEEPERPQGSCCGAPSVPSADYPYGLAAYVTGTLATPAGPVPQVSRDIVRADRLGAWRVRWGFGRNDYRVKPGLYALGTPDAVAPVLVTANYKLTFDQLRSSLHGLDAWLLVVDTRGINVWCAAGKGTFCAEEIARVVLETRLAEIVEHRRLILPQLSAPGVAAHRVKQACGFRAVFGPVRAADLPAFLAADMKADAEMRSVTFGVRERAALAPVELAVAWDRRILLAYGGILAASAISGDCVSLSQALHRGAPVIGAAWLALLAGGAVTPLALPWLPGRAFSLKGAVAGGLLAAAATAAFRRRLSPAAKLALLAGVPAASSYTAMNFTGSSPITSPSGVELEMRRALPLQAAASAVAIGAWFASRLGR
jgi:CO dehydrogenase/acetyl-CoA synthase delta subunit